MITKPQHCREDRLRLLLEDQLTDAERAEVERHLESCAACRGHLESLAGSGEWWQSVADSLRMDAHDTECSHGRQTVDSTSPAHAPRSGERGYEAAAQETISLHDTDPGGAPRDNITELLQPSDNPAVLGRIGDYEVVEHLGSGGMGVVFKAYDASLNRYVAIKLLAPHFARSAAARKRFEREARSAAAVVHPHVVAIHKVDPDAKLPYLVMQYVSGPTLQQRLDADGPLELAEVLRIALQAARGLAAAHAQGLVHRDVKPANILLEAGVERVLLTDFGLARAADDASLTSSGVVAGTPQYMSPEQAKGTPVDHRTDLFSLGSVMYAACAGQPPFQAETAVAVLRRICDDRPRPLREFNPAVPGWLAHIVERLHAKSPAERYASAGEVADLLEQCLAHVQQPAAHPLPRSLRRFRRWSWRSLRQSGVARGVLALAGIVLIAIAIAQWQPPRERPVHLPSPPISPSEVEVATPLAASEDLERELDGIFEDLRKVETGVK